MSEQQYGVPIDFASQGKHTDALARIMGGPDSRLLGNVYRGAEKTDQMITARDMFDAEAKKRFADHNNGLRFDEGFPAAWRRATSAHTQIARDLFGVDAPYFDLVNRISIPPIAPHDVYKALVRTDADPRYTHEARWLTTFTAIMLAAQERENDTLLRSALQGIDGAIDQELCVGGYGKISSGVLSSTHDRVTLKTLETQFGNSMIAAQQGAVMRVTPLSIRTMKLGDTRIPFYTGLHQKTEGSFIAKTMDKALSDAKNCKGILNPLAAVKDFHGLLMVPMHSDDYGVLKNAYLAHIRRTFPNITLADDHTASHGLGTSTKFERWNVRLDPNDPTRYVELMFQTPEQYLDGLVHIGDGKDGAAHELHRARRMLRRHKLPDGTTITAAEVLFPQEIYGVDPIERAERNMERIAEKIRRPLASTRQQKYSGLGMDDIA